jgi:hypothetical protein
MDNLVYWIKKRGYSVGGFGEAVLNMKYTTFSYNIKNKAFKYEQIKSMLNALHIKFEDLESVIEKPAKKEKPK